MLITVSHSGKQHSYHLANALRQLGALDKFYTSSYITQEWLQEYFTKQGNTFFTRRFVQGLHAPMVEANWRFELKEQYLRYRYGKGARAAEAVFARDRNFDLYMSEVIRKRKSEVFWGFQGSAHATLQAAKDSGKLAIVELATAHVKAAKRILAEETALHPEWADSIDYLSFPDWYEHRIAEEPHLADVVVAASQFTANTLLEDNVPQSKIRTLSLGFELDHVAYTPKREKDGLNIENRPLRLLYAGTITQRKGIKYVLEAMRHFKREDVELHIIGGLQGSGVGLEPYKGLYQNHGRISQYELFRTYQDYDALVLPTVFEGFGLVIVEAMAAGLPVITTPHSMGPDVIVHQENGYLIPIRSIEAVVSSIAHLRSLSGEDYCHMSEQARAHVLNFTWKVFQEKLAMLLTTLPVKA